MFIILTGSSGVGKNTVINHLKKSDDIFKLMPTFTTREKREGEVEEYPYFFVSKEQFQDKIKNNEMIEYEHIHNNFYGSSYKVLDDNIKDGKVLIKDIGIEGAQNLSIKISHLTTVLKIFLTTSKSELVKRLKDRGEKQIKLRLKRYKREQGEINKFDYIIHNNNLDETCKVIQNIYKINLQDILPTKAIKKISIRKINKFISHLQSGRTIKPVKVALIEDKLFIVDGHERFIAGLMTNKPVAKQIINTSKVFTLTNSQLDEWKELINQSNQ